MLITADVTSLYTVIAHDEGVKAINHFLITSNLSPNLQDFIIKGIRFILSNNYFYFEGNFYLQVQGTAMGTRFAPCYANIFLAKWELEYLPTAGADLVLWHRYIDDVFFIWGGSDEALKKFCSHLNNNNLNIVLTFDISDYSMNFLDITVTIKEGQITTENYTKSTDSNSYIPVMSNHLNRWLTGIPKGQFLRMKRNCSTEESYNKHLEIKKNQFLNKGYDDVLLDNTIKEIQNIERSTLLDKTNKTQRNYENQIPFISNYNSEFKKVEHIIRKHWDILKRDRELY